MSRRSLKFKLTPEQQVLAETNINLARDVAWKFQRSTNIEYSILESAAFEGLCQAAARYDPAIINKHSGQSMRFSSIAVPFIRGAILHYIRDRTYSMRLTHRIREIWSKGRKHWSSGLADIEVAEKLGITVEEWQDARSACSGPPLELKDQAMPSDGPEIEEVDHLSVFRAEAEHILEQAPPSLRRRLERFCRGRSRAVSPILARELAACLDGATMTAKGATENGNQGFDDPENQEHPGH